MTETSCNLHLINMNVDLLQLKEDDPMGYGFVKASWLQKCVRRGLVDKAVAIARLYLKDNQSEGLKRKLLVFTYEDIGQGTPDLNLLLKQESDLLKQTEMLCLAPKNRENDRFLLAVRDFYPELVLNPEIQDEVKALKVILELADNWFNNKRIKKNKEILQEAFKLMADGKSSTLKEVIHQAELDYFFLSKHNAFGARTALAHSVLLSIRKNIEVNFFQKPSQYTLPDISLPFVDDFALDKHTPFGKLLNKGEKAWLLEGSITYPLRTYPELYQKDGSEKYPYSLWKSFLV